MIILIDAAEEFLQLYKQLEFDGRINFFPDSKENDNIIGRLINTTQLKKYKESLDYCRVVRNFLTHNPKVNGVYPIVPSEEMLSLLKKCIRIVNNPPKAIDFGIKLDTLYTAKPDDRLSDVLETMNKFSYNHVPIIEEDKLIGVLSHNTFFSYIYNERALSITNDTLIREFDKYIKLDEHLNEYFEFVSKDAMLLEIEELFKYNYRSKRSKILAAVFFTQDGKRTQKILGMITPWDILGE